MEVDLEDKNMNLKKKPEHREKRVKREKPMTVIENLKRKEHVDLTVRRKRLQKPKHDKLKT